MINKKLNDAINVQIQEELFSAYLYASMLAYLQRKNLKGMAQWMRVQVQEEMAHATKFFDYLNERGGTVELLAIQKPKSDWNSPLEAFTEALAHEEHITACINNLVTLSMKEADYAAGQMLQWFVNEQVEEESNATENVENLKLAGNDGAALLMLDKEMGMRVFVPPTPTKNVA